ncbi:MAG: zinc ribbon domain-containing protein [Nitrospinota bacterium]
MVDLQNVDSEIKDIENKKEDIPGELDTHRERFQSAQKEIDFLMENIERIRKERIKKEQDVQIEGDLILKTKKKLPDVKTNKEYSALLAEIDSIKKKIDRFEDEELNLMEILEEKERDSERKKEELREEERKFQEISHQKEDEIARLNILFDEKLKRRNEIVLSLDGKLYENYTKLMDLKKGLAVAQFDDNACKGCYKGLPPQMVIEIKKMSSIINCPHCSRFLFWADIMGK